jgi:hypothetical protein
MSSFHDDARPTGPRASTFDWIDPAEADARAVLDRLLKEAASVVPGLSPDEKLTDPLVRLLLAAVSREYARLYAKLDGVIDMSYRKLVESLLSFPRAPRPSSTVLHLSVKDAGVRVDDELQVVGRKAIGGPGGHDERSIHFAPAGEEVIPGVPSPAVLLQQDGMVRLLAEGREAPGATPKTDREWSVGDEAGASLHLGFDLPPGEDVERLVVFLAGPEEAVGALLWSHWEAGLGDDRQDLVPGHLREMHAWHRSAQPTLFRSRTDQTRPESPYDRFFVHLPLPFLLAGRGAQHRAVAAGVEAGHIPSVPHRCWIKIALPDTVSPESLWTLRVLTNCVVAFNVNREFASFNVGTEPFAVVEMAVAFRDLFRIDEVRDAANGDLYLDAESPESLGSDHRFHLDTSPSGQVLLRLAARHAATRPRKIEVAYATTYGVEADGLDAGSVDVIYDTRLTPGVSAAINVVPSAGGGAPGQDRHHADELRAILASHGRATTRHDYVELTRAFDPRRVAAVTVDRGVVQTTRGLASCVHVRVRPAADVFQGRLELEAFRAALHEYLQVRAPAGQPVTVTLDEDL